MDYFMTPDLLYVYAKIGVLLLALYLWWTISTPVAKH